VRRGRRILVGVAVVVALQAAALAVYMAVESGRAAPAGFAVERLSGHEAATGFSALRADGTAVDVAWPAPKVRVVHFWATWCEPCRDELPGLLALAQGGVDVVAVAVDDDWADIRAFFAGAPPPQVVMARDAVHKAFGVSTLPDTYIVSRDGRLLERAHGARDWTAAAARDHLRAALR
jgi:thiol-disulfide isomerase/thioredoxin